jgi:hypothetical protein
MYALPDLRKAEIKHGPESDKNEEKQCYNASGILQSSGPQPGHKATPSA